MNLLQLKAPLIRSRITVNKIMYCVILALLPAAAFSIYAFGIRVLHLMLIGIISAVLTEAIFQKLIKRKVTAFDGSAILTGLLLVMCLPPTMPMWIPAAGSVFAILVVKQLFGGLGFNIFNPALCGRAFLTAAWPALISSYVFDGIATATPLKIAKFEGMGAVTDSFGSSSNMYQSMFSGNIAGSIGETSALLLLIGGLFLIFTKIIDWRIPSLYIGTVFVLSYVLGKDPLFNILAGGLFLGAFFMATDYVTSPMTAKGKIIFAICCGILTVVFRLFSGMPEGVCFSILLMNAFTPLIDRFTKPRRFGV